MSAISLISAALSKSSSSAAYKPLALFIQLYGISNIHAAGFVYLPFGVGSCIGAYVSGMRNATHRIASVLRHTERGCPLPFASLLQNHNP